MQPQTVQGLVARFRSFRACIEIGIGNNPDVAAELSRFASVTATDITAREVPEPVDFYVDDITDPDQTIYIGADLLYGINLPPELHGQVARCADSVGAAFAFTTLGADPPAIPVIPEMIDTDTIYWYQSRTESRKNKQRVHETDYYAG